MNRPLIALLAGAAMMSSGVVLAADQATQNRDTQTQTQPNASKKTPGETQSTSKGSSGQTQSQTNAAKGTAGETQSNSNAAKGTAGETQSNSNAAKGSSGETNAKSPANEQRPGVESKNENPDKPRDPKSVYSTELKKCDSLQGTEKQKCVAAAKKKSGEM
jgi:hypothetical protein